MKILCAVDGSNGSDETVQTLARHPWPPGTVIRMLTVAQSVHPPVVELVATGESIVEAQQALDSRCDGVAASAAETIAAAGITSEHVTLEGDPKSVIVEEAERWNADLLVVGHRGHSMLARIFLGSIAQFVAKHAPCSVLLIRHRASATEA